MGGNLSSVVEQMAQKLGVAAEHVYGVLVRQALITGVVEVTFGVLALIACAGLVWLTIWLFTPGRDRELFGFLSAIAVLMLVILSVALLTSGIGQLLNPEYYAIKDIFDALGGGN